jgi:hypothetical protein
MPKSSNRTRTADEIEDMASRGEDISAHFSDKFTVVRPVHHRELDERAARLNIRRQAVIKTLLGRALNEERDNKPRAKKPLAARQSGN